MIGKSKHAKCIYCDEIKDKLAEHLEAEHLQGVHSTAYLIQDLMIRIDQMENKIIHLQNETLARRYSNKLLR